MIKGIFKKIKYKKKQKGTIKNFCEQKKTNLYRIEAISIITKFGEK